MKPISSNTSSDDPEIQRQYAERQAAQQPQPVQGPRMVQGNPQQQEEDRDITHAAESGALPSQFRPEAGSDMRVVARSEAAAVTPLPAKPAVPVTREALNNAIRSNDLQTIRYLLTTGKIDLNVSKEEEIPPLALAAQCGCADAVSLLLQAGADVNAANHWGSTALMFAAQQGHVEVFTLLLRAGADIRAATITGKTVLMDAVEAPSEAKKQQLFALLREAGADMHAVDSRGKTVLMYAAGGGSVAIVQQLSSLGADINAADKLGLTVLMFAAHEGHADVFSFLQKAGANIHAADDDGKTVLQHAVNPRGVAILEQLLNLGVSVDAADRYGMTPLMLAAYYDYSEIFAFLVKAKAAIDAQDRSGKTVLMHSIRHGSATMVEQLLSLNVDSNAVDENGMTALMLAVQYGRRDNRELLLKHGANIHVCGTQVKSAMAKAIKEENIAMLELLLAYGGESTDLQRMPSSLVSDMLRHRALLKPEIVATAQTLESLYGEPLSSLPVANPNSSLPAELDKIFDEMQICSSITTNLNEQLHASDELWPALAGNGSQLSEAQKSMAIAGLLVGLEAFVDSQSQGWYPYQGKGLSEQGEANLTTLAELQTFVLVEEGELIEMKLASGLETLLPQCAQFTRVKNGEPVVEMTGLLAHLTGQLGLYGPLADQVAAAWFTAVNQQQAVILSSSLFQSAFDEQASESEAGQVLLAAFGLALKQIDGVAAGSLLRTSTLQGQQAGLYADLMFRQLHMLMQYADQARAAS